MLNNTSEYILFINIIDLSVKGFFFFICDFRGQNINCKVIFSTLHHGNNAIFNFFGIILKIGIIIILLEKIFRLHGKLLFRKN